MSKDSEKVAGFIGTAAQIIPMAVITITNTVPFWARVDMAVWLILWAVVVVVTGTT